MTRGSAKPNSLVSGLAIASFVAVVAVLSLRAGSRVNQPGARYPEIDPANWALRDFRDAVYYPVRALLDGVSPYHVSAFVEKYPVGQDFPPYSPLTLLLHLPFAWLPFVIAEWVYFGASILLTLVLAWIVLLTCRLPRQTATVFGLAAAMLATRPGHMNLLLGQTTNLLVLSSLLAFHLASKNPWGAGLCFAISTFKPTYGPILLILAAAMGEWRAVKAGLLWTVLITAPMVLWVVSLQGGWSESWTILRDNSQALYDNPGRDPAHSFSRIDALSLWSRLAQPTPNQAVEPLVTMAIVAVACLVLYFARRGRPMRGATDPSVSFALLMMLVSAYHHAYDALFLIQILLAAAFQCDPFWRRWPAVHRWLWCALIALPLANYIATNSGISAWQISGTTWTIVTCANGGAILAAAIWLAIAMLTTRDIERGDQAADKLSA